MIGEGGWPVFDPGAHSLADLYPYVELVIDKPEDIDVSDLRAEDAAFQQAEEKTPIMPSAWLVERCTTAATWGRR